MRKGTPIIVVDNSNILESEYLHLMEFAQQEHYIASVVQLPAPHDFEEAAQRSTKNVTAGEISSMLSIYEPTSLAKLTKKNEQMHELSASRRMSGLKISPKTSPRNVKRRSSSATFQEIPESEVIKE